MSAETKTYEDKMTGVINHLVKEHATIRAGRANPAILDKVTVDYYGTPTPINQVAAVSVAEARVLTISRETRTANAIGDLNGAIDAMPRLAVTIGMAEILGAKKIRLGVFRDWHRAVVRQAAYGEVSAHFPATLCQRHPDAKIIVNANAAARAF